MGQETGREEVAMPIKCYEFTFSTLHAPHPAYGSSPRIATNRAFCYLKKPHYTFRGLGDSTDFQLKIGEEMTVKIKRLS
jgi:hypothetical protein